MKIKTSFMGLPFRSQFFKACLWAMIVIASLSVWKSLISYDDATPIYLSISLKSSQKGIAELFYDTGRGFNSTQVVSASIREDAQVSDYLFRIPNKSIRNLRLDPPFVQDNIIPVYKMEIMDGSRKPVKRLNLHQIEPLQQIASLTVSDEKADIQVQEGANDPQVRIRLESPLSVNNYYSLFLFAGTTVLEFLSLLLVTFLLIYIGLRFRDKVIATVIVVSLVIFGWRCLIWYDDAGSLFLKVNMGSTVNGTAQVYYDLGQGLNEKHMQPVDVIGQKDLHSYQFKLPNAPIYELRFDPLMTKGNVRIGGIIVTDAFGRVIREIDLKQIRPLKQIKSIQIVKNELDVSVAEDADDPQLAIDLYGYLNVGGKLPFPVGKLVLKLITEAIVCLLIASILFLAWRKWGNLCLDGLDSPFVQEKVPLIYLGAAFGMMLAMGFVSGLDVHPDEWGGHMKAATYYIRNWLPPAVDDPRIINSISSYGVSYLWHIDPLYFIAVKATQFLSGIVSDFYLRLRLFNAFLFLALGLFIAAQIKRSKWVVPFLLATPQLWYVFSYFNNDAFPWFIAIFLAMQVVDPESSLNRFISAPVLYQSVSGGILSGILLGLLISSKLNYRLYIAFLIFVALWKILFEMPSRERIPRLKKWIFIGSVALLFYLPIYGYDQYVNDFNKTEKVMSAMEHYAEPRFRLSALQDDFSSKGFHLKDKGVSFQELFLHNTFWRDMSFKSFFGVYGYMKFFPSADYYRAVNYALSVFFLLVFFYVAFTLSIRDMIFSLFVLLFAILAVGQSAYHSWINDFQAQGRYLFLILPMFLVGLSRLPASFRTRIMPLFGIIFFFLSVWSFLLTGFTMIPKIN